MVTPGKSNDIQTIDWQPATLLSSKEIAENIKAFVFAPEKWIPHKSGQHYSIRLTSPDGYQSERDYSIASEPEKVGQVEFGIEKLPEGEVSPYIHSLKIGEQIEIKGPLGGHFIWDTEIPGPLILIGGGSGMVPLVSMIRHHFANFEKDRSRKISFLVSAKTSQHILYKDELETFLKKDPHFNFLVTVTEEDPEWSGLKGRINQDLLKEVLKPFEKSSPNIFICGPTGFVEAMASMLVSLGVDAKTVKTERFG